MARGSLRIYLGASPGVGKTFAMLDEGYRRCQRGSDVVIGVVETHGRQRTAQQMRDLELVPRIAIDHRGTVVHEMDLDAILARRPKVVLVDEFAHTNAPGSRNEKRWQDVEVLLDAGIDVISTLNVQHLESLNDVITRITGTVQRETVPDAIVRRADQIELVDMSPEAIRRRMAHGNIYPAERVDAALANWFRPGNLGALRELALLWVADRVEESLSSYLAEQGITDAWETRERVVVGITGGAGGEALIRRAARIAGRVGGDLIGVHVVADDGLVGTTADDPKAAVLAAQRRLVDELGGTVRDVVGNSLAEALVAFARGEKATQLVLGASRRSRWYEWLHGSLVARVTRLAGDIDIHVIATRDPHTGQGGRNRTSSAHAHVDTRRIWWAWILTAVGLPALTALGVAIRGGVALETQLLVFLSAVLLIASVGGRLVGAVASVVASLLVNWFFVEPYYTLTIADPENIVALVVFVAVAITVGTLVDSAARRAVDARRSRVEAEALARAAATLAADPDPMPRLAEQLRVAANLDAVRICRRESDAWRVLAESGTVAVVGDGADRTPTIFAIGQPNAGDEAGDDEEGGKVREARHRLELYGRPLSADDQRMLRALVDQLAVAIDHQQLAHEVADANALADIDAVRTALLRAVSHDLRTPLASIKAMVTGLLDRSVDWTDAQLAEALATVDEETDRLNRLVGNLLDASRLQMGALAMNIVDVDLAEAVSGALDSLGPQADEVTVELPSDLPMVRSDMVLLERSLANVISNAVRHGGAEGVRITAGVVGDEVRVCIIDRGPGIPLAQRHRVMVPFQRLGDSQTVDGVGLGMSIAQGFVVASGGSMTLDDTPGGGLTVTMALSVGASASSADRSGTGS